MDLQKGESNMTPWWEMTSILQSIPFESDVPESLLIHTATLLLSEKKKIHIYIYILGTSL